MKLQYFTRVYKVAAPALRSEAFARFFAEIEDVVISDVAFALTGKQPKAKAGATPLTKQVESK